MEDVFGRRNNGGRGMFFVEKFKNGGRDPIFFMVGTLTQHAWYAKSQSAATFCEGAVRVFAATTPSLILCPHPLKLIHESNQEKLLVFKPQRVDDPQMPSGTTTYF